MPLLSLCVTLANVRAVFKKLDTVKCRDESYVKLVLQKRVSIMCEVCGVPSSYPDTSPTHQPFQYQPPGANKTPALVQYRSNKIPFIKIIAGKQSGLPCSIRGDRGPQERFDNVGSYVSCAQMKLIRPATELATAGSRPITTSQTHSSL